MLRDLQTNLFANAQAARMHVGVKLLVLLQQETLGHLQAFLAGRALIKGALGDHPINQCGKGKVLGTWAGHDLCLVFCLPSEQLGLFCSYFPPARCPPSGARLPAQKLFNLVKNLSQDFPLETRALLPFECTRPLALTDADVHNISEERGGAARARFQNNAAAAAASAYAAWKEEHASAADLRFPTAGSGRIGSRCCVSERNLCETAKQQLR